MIKNIFLDLDDTIFDFHIAERTALTKTLEYLGIEPKEKILDRYSVLNLQQWKLLEKGEITRAEVKVRRYRLLFDELGIDCSPEAAAAYYENQLAQGHWFMDGAEELLDQAVGKYRLFIVSNGTAKVQWGRLKSSGIEKHFTNIFISQEIGFNKPSIEFFNSCFAKIDNFDREETIIVGDSISSDIKGGKNAGIKTVWYNPKGEKSAAIKPDYTIKHLRELLPLLKSL